MRCFWCDTDPDEITGRPEGPHSIYCLGFRVKLYPPGVTTETVNGRVVYRFPEANNEPLTAMAYGGKMIERRRPGKV